MEETKTISESMQQTIEYGNLEFVGDIGELIIDSVFSDGVLRDIPIIGSIVGVGKCLKNVYDVLFAKKLIAFLIPIKEVPVEQRLEAIRKWEQDEYYRGKVGDTLLGMIARCDDVVKANWLSKLFLELVLKRNCSRLFMRAEKTLSSLSIMDLQAFLNMPKDDYQCVKEEDVEPYIGSGLYQNPQIATPKNETLNFNDKYCKSTRIGIWIYGILNDIPVPEDE